MEADTDVSALSNDASKISRMRILLAISTPGIRALLVDFA
jgi:hypothetical protein